MPANVIAITFPVARIAPRCIAIAVEMTNMPANHPTMLVACRAVNRHSDVAGELTYGVRVDESAQTARPAIASVMAEIVGIQLVTNHKTIQPVQITSFHR